MFNKKSLIVHKTTFRKKCKKRNIKKKHESVHNLWRILGTKLVPIKGFLDHIYETVFPKHFLKVFFTLNSKMSRKMCKLRHKVPNGQNLPLESPNFTNFFSK